MYGLGAEILLRLREGPLQSVRAVATSVGEKPTNPATTWRALRRLRQDGLVVRLPGLGWVHRDDKAALSAWRERLPTAALHWLREAGPPFRFNKNGSPWYWDPDLDEVRRETWRASGGFPREDEIPLAFAAMKWAADRGPLERPSILPAHLAPRELALRYGDEDLRQEILKRQPWALWEDNVGGGEKRLVSGPCLRDRHKDCELVVRCECPCHGHTSRGTGEGDG